MLVSLHCQKSFELWMFMLPLRGQPLPTALAKALAKG